LPSLDGQHIEKRRDGDASLVMSATLTWLGTQRRPAAKADTMWIAVFPPLVWEEPRDPWS
jgi:hypothetical protein